MGTSKTGIFRDLAAAPVSPLPRARVAAEGLAGRAVGARDGDASTVPTGGERRIRVGPAGIDAPEGARPHGARARGETSGAVSGERGRIAVRDHGRAVGRVRAEGRDVDAERSRRGAAWDERRRASIGAAAELQRRRHRRTGSEPRGSWESPRAERVPRGSGARPPAGGGGGPVVPRERGSRGDPSGGPTCGPKRTCRGGESRRGASFTTNGADRRGRTGTATGGPRAAVPVAARPAPAPPRFRPTWHIFPEDSTWLHPAPTPNTC